MNNKALQPNAKLKDIKDLLEMRKGEIAKAAPRIVDTKRLMRICLSSIQKNPLLLECSPASLYRCVMDAATFGLVPDGATQECHLIPFYSSKKKCYEAQFMPGYSGIIKLALQSGYIDGVELHEVYANDEFEYEYGLDQKLIHRPTEGDTGDLRAVYCIVLLSTGHKTFEVMTIKKAEEHRDKFSKSKNKDGQYYGPWVDHFNAMALKTVLKRGLKYTPKSSELAGALKLDGLQEAGKDRDDPEILDIKPSGPAKTGVEGFDNALAGGDDDIPIETDLRAAISDHLTDKYPKHPKKRLQDLMEVLENICGPTVDSLTINGVNDLSPELAAKVAAEYFDKGK
jgi:recombination protein RecT